MHKLIGDKLTWLERLVKTKVQQIWMHKTETNFFHEKCWLDMVYTLLKILCVLKQLYLVGNDEINLFSRQKEVPIKANILIKYTNKSIYLFIVYIVNTRIVMYHIETLYSRSNNFKSFFKGYWIYYRYI